jgi:transcription initiation factor TFIIIB Brf1 subunit/transcription initiation factor TFIIB
MPIGVVVKYNPCSTYARLGKSCPRLAERQQCALKFGLCSDKEYDLWFKDVIKGKINYFFPKKIPLLAIPGTVLVLYHCGKRALVGEARISKATFEAGNHKYFFDKFILYPKNISLSNKNPNGNFRRISAGGRWWFAYINEETVNEIRKLSGLNNRTREELRKELEHVRGRVTNFLFTRKCGKFNLEEELRKHSASGTDHKILDRARDMFMKMHQVRATKGRQLQILFYAALYVAFRSFGATIVLKDVSKRENIDQRKLASAVRLLIDRLEINLPRACLEEWVQNSLNLLKLPKKTMQSAVALAEGASRNNKLRGKSPQVLSAAVIYAACVRTQVPKKQKEISDVLNVSAASLRNLSKVLLENIRTRNAQIIEHGKEYAS